MSNSIQDKNFTPDEVAKLKSCINAVVVCLQQIDDVRANAKDLVTEVADALEIKAADINEAAKTLYKQNFAQKRDKQEKLEEMLETLGYYLDDTPEV